MNVVKCYNNNIINSPPLDWVWLTSFISNKVQLLDLYMTLICFFVPIVSLFRWPHFCPPVQNILSIHIVRVCVCVWANNSSGSLSLRVLNHKQGDCVFVSLPLVPVESQQWVTFTVCRRMFSFLPRVHFFTTVIEVTPYSFKLFMSAFLLYTWPESHCCKSTAFVNIMFQNVDKICLLTSVLYACFTQLVILILQI